MTVPQDNLLTRLTQADVCCMDCGRLYGKYSVGCSSVWQGACDVCGEHKGVTEVRDFGYLVKGINELQGAKVRPFSELTKDFSPERKEKIKEQSKVVASYMASVGPIMNDAELENCLTASYEQGDISCKFTEAEIQALADVLDAHQDAHPTGWNEYYDSAFMKITDLYDDFVVKYDISPALKSYHAKYGTWGHENEEEIRRWEGFRDAFVMLQAGTNEPTVQ